METFTSRAAVNAAVLSRKGRRIRKYLIPVATLACVVMATWFVLAVRHAQAEAVRMRNFGRLSYLRAAIANYESAHGTLPSRELAKRNNAMRQNWLVSILPHIEQAELHARLDLESRWDTPGNLNVARSDSMFQHFISMDGYAICPLDAEESIWSPKTGMPIGKLTAMPNSILLLAIPVKTIEPFQPMSVTKEELLAMACDGKRTFFIRCDGKYGPVRQFNGKVDFTFP